MGVPDIKVAAVTDDSREAAEAMAGKTGASVWDSPGPFGQAWAGSSTEMD
jgi:hypothetical protein